ncbi:MAG TPA: serine hydrolase, partial [Acidimicrobiales bacterium]|nr:serine hydrolase [Acidimicrobiales bacterium]
NASDRFGTVDPGGLAQVRALAGAMIHQSDNTATEVLLDLVGREAVEQVQARMGMVRPEQNIPFLSLAEWARLKFGRPPSADEYAALPDVAARRRFIDERVANRSAGPRETTTPARPIHIDTVEWFASPEDICRAHVALQEMARRPGLEPLRSILRTTFTWLKPTADYIGFKGGSEPGVYDLTFYIERGGKRYAVVMLLSNPERHFRASPAIVRDAYRLLTASKAR